MKRHPLAKRSEIDDWEFWEKSVDEGSKAGELPFLAVLGQFSGRITVGVTASASLAEIAAVLERVR